METTPNSCVMLRLISRSVAIASKAGAEVRRIIKTGKLDVVDKGIEDYQTIADRTVQRMIVASLSKSFPKCKIVGEEDLPEDKKQDERLIVDDFDEQVLKKTLPENYQKYPEEELTIWVDPLDGTAEFVKGFLDHVTILIGISANERAIAGIIHQPFYGYTKDNPNKELNGRTIWGVVGLGCFGLVPQSLPQDKLIVTTTSSHGNKDNDDAIVSIKPDEVIRVGGAGNKVLMVIEGRAHSYVFASNGCKKWDTCAPEAILESLGGILTNVFCSHIIYNSDPDHHVYLGVIASVNRELHTDKILAHIPEKVSQNLAKFEKENHKYTHN